MLGELGVGLNQMYRMRILIYFLRRQLIIFFFFFFFFFFYIAVLNIIIIIIIFFFFLIGRQLFSCAVKIECIYPPFKGESLHSYLAFFAATFKKLFFSLSLFRYCKH